MGLSGLGFDGAANVGDTKGTRPLGMATEFRIFQPPWSTEDVGGNFVVKASKNRPLAWYISGFATKQKV